MLTFNLFRDTQSAEQHEVHIEPLAVVTVAEHELKIADGSRHRVAVITMSYGEKFVVEDYGRDVASKIAIANLPEGECTIKIFTLAGDIVEEFHHVPAWVVWSPFVAMVIGFAVSWLFYIRKPDLPQKLAEQHQPVYQFLLNKWYFDEIYDAVFTRPAKWMGSFLWTASLATVSLARSMKSSMSRWLSSWITFWMSTGARS